jgi:hypothetical protein
MAVRKDAMALDSSPKSNSRADSDWPETIEDFERFLTSAGLVRQQDIKKAPFGNKLLQYGNTIAVQIIRDRNDWFIRIAEPVTHPNIWYPISLIQELLKGGAETGPAIADEIDYVRRNWDAILRVFDAEHREQTHDRLYKLGREGVRKRFPGLISEP